MIRKLIKWAIGIFLGLFALIYVLATFWFNFRIADDDARKQFEASDVEVAFEDFHIGDRTLHYVQSGNDTSATLVFLHGSPGSWEDYIAFMKDSALTRRFRTIAIDRPGFGHSDYGDAVNLKEEADQLESLLLHLNNGKPLHLIGHSMGGPVAAWLAADNLSHVRSAVILAGALDPQLEPNEPWRQVLDVFPLCYLLPGAFRPSNTELYALKTDLYELANKMPDVHCDVYILHGDKDMLVDFGNVGYMESHFTNASSIHVTKFQNENHFLPWTRFREIKTLLLSLSTE